MKPGLWRCSSSGLLAAPSQATDELVDISERFLWARWWDSEEQERESQQLDLYHHCPCWFLFWILAAASARLFHSLAQVGLSPPLSSGGCFEEHMN